MFQCFNLVEDSYGMTIFFILPLHSGGEVWEAIRNQTHLVRGMTSLIRKSNSFSGMTS